MSNRISWEEYALSIANVVKIRSEDPFFTVGCTILRKNHTIAGTGYNGIPSGKSIDWSDRSLRRPKVIHAESNAIKHAAPYCIPGDCYLAATTLFPCLDCFKQLVNFGIQKIVYLEESTTYAYDNDYVKELAKEWNIELKQIIL